RRRPRAYGRITRTFMSDVAHAAEIITRFHQLYYDLGFSGRGTWMKTSWLGVPLATCPLDLWVYQELMHAIRPQLVIETGTAYGGSALFLANTCDLIGGGEVISVDLKLEPNLPQTH